MKNYIAILFFSMSFGSFAQEVNSPNSNSSQISITNNADSLVIGKDSLQSSRSFFTTEVYSKNIKKAKREILSIYSQIPNAKSKYNLGRRLLPVAAISSVGGLFLIYNSINGVSESAVINTKTYDYKIRSFPKLLVGLGLITIGVCLLEYSNELIKTSVTIYNSQHKSISYNSKMERKLEMGITPNGNFGVFAQF